MNLLLDPTKWFKCQTGRPDQGVSLMQVCSFKNFFSTTPLFDFADQNKRKRREKFCQRSWRPRRPVVSYVSAFVVSSQRLERRNRKNKTKAIPFVKIFKFCSTTSPPATMDGNSQVNQPSKNNPLFNPQEFNLAQLIRDSDKSAITLDPNNKQPKFISGRNNCNLCSKELCNSKLFRVELFGKPRASVKRKSFFNLVLI